MNKRLKLTLGVLAVLGLAGILGRVVPAGSIPGDSECVEGQAANDKWLETQLDTAYLFNTHLNDMSIDSEVEDGDVTLTGAVRSDIDRDLAEEIARSLDGVKSVENALEVRKDLAEPALPGSDTDFLQKVKDATTTAQVKTRLIGNGNISAGEIDVDTRHSVVRLSGKVNSDTERQLAEFIARNTSGVLSVANELEIVRSG